VKPTRRIFLKTGTGAAVASVLGFDLKPAYAQSRELKDCAYDGDSLHLPVLLGQFAA